MSGRLFHGLSAFPLTPADEGGHIDAGALRALLARLVDAGVDSIGLLGSTGISPYLSREERRRAVEVAVDQAGGKVPVMAGVGALRTDETIRLCQDAREAGAAAGLLAPVSYIPLRDDEVFAHFAAVSAATDLPLCIYNNPDTTRFTFGAELIGRLSRLPHVAAVKEIAPAPDAVAAHLRRLREQVAPGFSIGYCVDWHAAEALLAGGEAWYSVLGGLFPELVLPIVRAAQAGDAAEARRRNAALQPVWDLFRDCGGSLRVIYAAASLLGLSRAVPPRPLLPLPEAARERTGRVLKELGLL